MKLAVGVCYYGQGDNEGADAVIVDCSAQILMDLKDKCNPLFNLPQFVGVKFFNSIPVPVIGFSDHPALEGNECLLDNNMDISDRDISLEDFEEFEWDCPIINVDESGVYWSFHGKHEGANSHYETNRISWEEIEEALNVENK